MSDIRPTQPEKAGLSAGNSRRDWQSLRLLIVPDIGTQLLVSLVVVPRGKGHPYLHPFLRTFPAPWDPNLSVQDDKLYALSRALVAVNQTRM